MKIFYMPYSRYHKCRYINVYGTYKSTANEYAN
nr:MAG TPA: hypothetical protein [Caudoviricetes sp.]